MVKELITVLGNSAALPAHNRHLSAYMLERERESLLFDCGEATQFQLIKYKKKIHRITKVFITHLHGDHFFGLPGLLSTLHMLDRKKPIDIYGPKGLEQYINLINKITNSVPKYQINFHVVDTDTKVLICENKDYSIFAFPLDHREETYGYLYQQKPSLPNIKKDFIVNNEIPIEWFKRIKNGEDYIDENGKIIPNSEITEIRKPIKSFAYCTDTVYMPKLVEYVKNVDLLYHEATFLNVNKEDAIAKKHSTASDAANIAKDANVGRLIIGHFSARYANLEQFEKESKAIFENTIIAEEGMSIEL